MRKLNVKKKPSKKIHGKYNGNKSLVKSFIFFLKKGKLNKKTE